MASPKQLIQFVSDVYQSLEGSELNPQSLLTCEASVKMLTEFYSVSEKEMYILSFFLIKGLSDEKSKACELISHVGCDINLLPEVIDIMVSLQKKKLLLFYNNSRKNKYIASTDFKVHYKALDALFKADSSLLQAKQEPGFLGVLNQIDEAVRSQKQDGYSGSDLASEIDNICSINDHLLQVKWLNNLDLSIEHKAIFLIACVNHLKADTLIDLDDIIPLIYDDTDDRFLFLKSLRNKKNELLDKSLFTLPDLLFEYLGKVQLHEDATHTLFLEDESLLLKEIPLKLCTLIKYNTIEKEEILLNKKEASLIATLSESLTPITFDRIIQHLRKNNLPEYFSVILHGAPGTGKTATAKQLARLTNRHLLSVDISKIKGSYVGETEKNMQAVFNEYQKAMNFYKIAPILLFNEADSILGNRISVTSSVDQMNNSMQNILLQRMEDFKGILIATTNKIDNLDTAFDRRFLYKIKFTIPEEDVRLSILKYHFPEIMENNLAIVSKKYNLTGAQIQNIKRKLLINKLIGLDTATSDADLLEACETEMENFAGFPKKSIGFLANKIDK